jgi:tetratricopeptide (TPR) repeat protein
MAFVVLGYDLERSAKGSSKLLQEAILNYGIAGRLLVAQRDTREPKEILQGQDVSDSIEEVIGARRVELARGMPAGEMAKIFQEIEKRSNELRKNQSDAAGPEGYGRDEMAAAVTKSDLVADLAKGERLLDESTGKAVSRELMLLSAQGHYELARGVIDANGKPAPKDHRESYLAFFKAIQRLHDGAFAKAVLDLNESLDEQARASLLPPPMLHELALHFAQRANVAGLKQQPSTMERTEIYLKLSDAATRVSPKLAARMAVAALATAEDLRATKDNVRVLDRAQNAALALAEQVGDYRPEFEQVAWKYVQWAGEYLDGRLKLEPDMATRVFRIGLQLHERYVMALAKDDASRMAPLGTDYMVAGNLATKRNANDEAIGYYTKVVALIPRADNAYRLRGRLYRLRREFDKAIDDFTKAIAINRNDYNHYMGRAQAYLAAGTADRAVEDMTMVIQLRTRYDESFRFRGIALIAAGDLERAATDFTKAIEIDRNDPNYYHGRAWAYFKAGKHDEALADVTKAADLAVGAHPSLPQILDTRGHILKAKGREAEARADFKRAQELKPGPPLALEDLIGRLGPLQ